jgi:hypothetical protein
LTSEVLPIPLRWEYEGEKGLHSSKVDCRTFHRTLEIFRAIVQLREPAADSKKRLIPLAQAMSWYNTVAPSFCHRITTWFHNMNERPQRWNHIYFELVTVMLFASSVTFWSSRLDLISPFCVSYRAARELAGPLPEILLSSCSFLGM